MRGIIKVGLVLTALAVALPAAAQAPPPPMKIFASSAEVTALMAKAKAKAAADPTQVNVSQPLLSLEPYHANLEYRTGHAAGAIHPVDAEMFYVIDGAGTMVTGGQLVMPSTASRAGALPEIQGGEARHLVKGDIVFVPQNTPHQVTAVDGVLVLMSMHVPRP